MPVVRAPDFGPTRWSLVMALRSAADASQARQRLIELCLHYWYPVYAYLRRSGHAPEQAQRLTAAFFTRLLQAGPRLAAEAGAGRFRLYLQAELQRYLAQAPWTDEASPELQPPLPLGEMEARRQAEPQEIVNAEQAFQRGFALEVIARARARLREEARGAGHLAMYEVLERHLGTEPAPGDYEADARRLGVRALFVALAVRRLRQRFRELVEIELSQTVASDADLDSERTALLAAITGAPR